MGSKQKAGSAAARHWAMLSVVPRYPSKVTTSEIAARLKNDGHVISRRTIERDLNNLSGVFPLALDDRTRPFGWSWARGANFEFMPKLSQAQATALLLAQEHLKQLIPLSLYKDLLPIFDAASKAVVQSGWKNWHKRTAILPTALPLIPPALDRIVLNHVESALARNRRFNASYRSKGSRTLKPLSVNPLGILVRGQVMYLVCTLFDYADIRQLALHRLSDVVEQGDAAIMPPGFNFKAYTNGEGAQLLSQGEIKLVCRFEVSAAEHLVESQLAGDQSWTLVEGGQRVEVRATVQNDERLKWWLLGFGSQVEVMAPRQLRDWFRAELHAVISQYRQ